MVTEAHLGAFSQDLRFVLRTCFFFFLSKSTVSQGKLWADTWGWVQWRQARNHPSSARSPGSAWERSGWRAPSLQTLAKRRVPPNTNLLEPRQCLPKPWHIPMPCAASSICLTHHWDYVLVAVLVPRELCQTRGRCSHREEQLWWAHCKYWGISRAGTLEWRTWDGSRL